jgi:hypothetical protein
MKKRYKAVMIIGVGALVYGVGIMMGVSFLSGDKSQTQPNVASSVPSMESMGDSDILSKWVANIQPAAGESDQKKE